jgi:hypothetical protein
MQVTTATLLNTKPGSGAPSALTLQAGEMYVGKSTSRIENER